MLSFQIFSSQQHQLIQGQSISSNPHKQIEGKKVKSRNVPCVIVTMRSSVTKQRGMNRTGHCSLIGISDERGRSTQNKPSLNPNPPHNQTWLLYVPPMTQDWNLPHNQRARDVLAHRNEDESREEKKRRRGRGMVPHLRALGESGEDLGLAAVAV